MIKYNKHLSEATKSMQKGIIFENAEWTDTYLLYKTMRIVDNPVWLIQIVYILLVVKSLET